MTPTRRAQPANRHHGQSFTFPSTQIAAVRRLGSGFYLFSFLASGGFTPFLFVHFTELGVSGQQIGWLSILTPLMMLLLATAIASRADQGRRRFRILQAAIAGQALLWFLLGLAPTFGWIAAGMLGLAVVTSPFTSLSEGLIARMAQRHGISFGGMRLWGSIGYAASALVFGSLWKLVGFRPMFLIDPLFLLFLVWLTGRLEEPPAKQAQVRRPALHSLRDASFFLLLASTFLAAISNSLAMTFGGIYARSLGGDDLLIGMLTAFPATSDILTMFLSERILKWLRSTQALLVAYAVMALAFVGWVFVPDANAVLAFSIIKGLGYGLWITVTVRMTVERTPVSQAATAQSFLAISRFGLAPLVAGPVGGWIHDTIGANAVFGLGVVSLYLAAVMISLPVLQAATPDIHPE